MLNPTNKEFKRIHNQINIRKILSILYILLYKNKKIKNKTYKLMYIILNVISVTSFELLFLIGNTLVCKNCIIKYVILLVSFKNNNNSPIP